MLKSRYYLLMTLFICVKKSLLFVWKYSFTALVVSNLTQYPLLTIHTRWEISAGWGNFSLPRKLGYDMASGLEKKKVLFV